MSKDVRIEVIYYKTPADISLEFGLHGNYPLRMLSENCNDRSTFFHHLKRAVSRSEIIIVIGGYNSEDKIPQFISRAVGHKSCIPDYKSQNIDVDAEYPIPETAEILTTKFSNRFGGFLLECGPQTIISLADEKFTRNTIIKEFVVNYITEHHKVFNSTPSAIKVKELKENKTSVTPDFDEITEVKAEAEIHIDFQDISSISEHTDEITDKPDTEEKYSETVTPDNAETDDLTKLTESIVEPLSDIDNRMPETIDTSETAESLTDNTVKNTDSSDEKPIIQIDITENDNTSAIIESHPLQIKTKPDISDDFDFIDESYPIKHPKKHHRRRRKIRVLCIILSILVVLGSFAAAFLVKDKPISTSANDYYTQLSTAYGTSNENRSEAFSNLLKINPDFFTWIKFKDGKINHPVLTVKTSSEIDDYMTKLPNNSADKRGTLVSLGDGIIVNNAYNTVIYGNASDGGLLETFSLFSPNFKGQYITAADSNYSSNWQIFATFSSKEAGSFDYTQSSFADSNEYLEFLNKITTLSPGFDHEFSGIEKVLTIVGKKGDEDLVTVAVLRSMLILSVPEYIPDESSSIGSDFSSEITSSDTENTESEIENNDHNDYLGETPDIVLPALPSLPPVSSEVTSSSAPSQSTSSEQPSSSVDSSTESSQPEQSTVTSTSQPTSSEVTSAQPSSPSVTESGSSSNVTSSAPQSSISSVTSSAVSQPSEPKPNIDPLYTWDVYLACKSNSTGEVIIGDAVTIIAMIIEIEMSPTIDPAEALIAQAVVKYNWMINNGGLCTVEEDGAIVPPKKAPTNAIDTNPTPQALKYAKEAKGMLLIYGNTLAKTYCHSYSAGYTSAYHNIWGGGNYPYLQGVECPVDSTHKKYETVTKYSSETIKTLIKNKLNVDVSNMPKTDWLKPVAYDNNNTYCVTISIGGIEKKGTYLRNDLLKGTGIDTIRSSAYTIEYNETNDEFVVTTRGHGHGVGLSQYGAKQYAKQGWNCEQILNHFFPGTTLIKY